MNKLPILKDHPTHQIYFVLNYSIYYDEKNYTTKIRMWLSVVRYVTVIFSDFIFNIAHDVTDSFAAMTVDVAGKSKHVAGSTNIKYANLVDTKFTKINRYYSYFFSVCVTKYENF